MTHRPGKRAVAMALIIFTVLCLLVIGCGKQEATPAPIATSKHGSTPTPNQSTPVNSATVAKSPAAAIKTASAAPVNVIRLKPIKIVDQQGTGIEALSLLVPTDWNTAGEVEWVLDNPIMPATVNFKVSSPDGTQVFELFPSLSLFWTTNQGLLNLFPKGSRYFGSEVSPLVEPDNAFSDFVLPRYREEVQGLKIVNKQATPDAAGSLTQQSPLKTSVKGGLLRVEYQKNGKLMEDELFCKVEAVYIPVQGLAGTSTNINWGITNISSFSAEKGKLDASTKIFETISRSTKLNPQWFSKYNEVVGFLIKNQIQKIRSAGELSKILAQTSDQISSEMLQSYNDQQTVNDKIADNWDQYIRGVDTYYDPTEQKQVELPAGYNNAWKASNGEYIVTESTNFNPNIDTSSNLNWQPLKKQ